MKKTIYFILLLFSSIVSAQENSNKVIQERLFTVDEITRLQVAYYIRIPELNLSEESLHWYETVVDDHFFYMIHYNKKRNRTKAQINAELERIVAKQSKTLKKKLSNEQYNKHLEIYNTVIYTAIKNRLYTL